jgi:hypothetical protein
VEVQFQPVIPASATNLSSGSGGVGNLEEATYDLRYILEMWTTDGTTPVHRDIIIADNYTASVNFSANLPAAVYQFVFWADFVNKGSTDDLTYNTGKAGGLKDIELITSTYALSSDLRDAYYATKDVDLTSGPVTDNTVTLTRPFGKLRILATDLHDDGVVPVKAVVTYTHAAPPLFRSSFNAFAGEPNATTIDAGGNLESISSELEASITVGGNSYNNVYLLAFDYFLIPGDLTAVSFNIEVFDASGSLGAAKSISNVPVGINKLTTVIGAFLSSQSNNANFTVIVDDDFDGDDVYTTTIASVSLSKTELSLYTSEEETLIATVLPENAADKSVTWESNDTGVVTVDQDGNVTAVAPGAATITATSNADDTKTADCAVMVAARSLTGIAVTTQPTQKNYFVDDLFDPAGMVVTGTYDYGDPEVLTITAAHLTYDFSSPGTKTVTITVDGQTAQVTDITVIAPTLAQSIATAITVGTPTTITLYADESLAPTVLNTAGTDITLVSDGPERTVTLSSDGSLFTLTNGAQLTLGNGVTLKGLGIDNANTGSLITINAGTLTMNNGSKLTDNWKNGDNGSAVWVMDNGAPTLTTTQAYFIMNDGIITGNKATTQGAVFVKGLFTMNGGTISNNSVTNTSVENGKGGGVFNSANGRIVMTGGNITGNTAVIGSGVYLGDGSSFIMTGGAITGNTNNSLGNNDLYITTTGPEGKAKFAGAVTAVVTLHGASNGSGDKSKITQIGEITGNLTVNIYTSSASSSDGRTIITSDASYMGTLNTDKITLGNFIFNPPPSPAAIGDSYTLDASTGNLTVNP